MLALSAWTAIWSAILARHGGIAWIFFVKGSSLLFTGNYNGHNRPGFLHLYASYPGLQIGPLAFGVAQVIRTLIPGQPIGPLQGVATAQFVMSALGLIALVIIRRIALTARPELAMVREFGWAFLAGGAVFMVGWCELAVAYGHLDDALALLLAAAAVLAAVKGHPVLTGLGIGLATDAKPWALIFLPVLALGAGLARWPAPDQAGRPIGPTLRAAAIAAVTGAAAITAAWLPFFIAAPRTARALHYTIGNMPDSALRALGFGYLQTPNWDRQAQIIVPRSHRSQTVASHPAARCGSAHRPRPGSAWLLHVQHSRRCAAMGSARQPPTAAGLDCGVVLRAQPRATADVQRPGSRRLSALPRRRVHAGHPRRTDPVAVAAAAHQERPRPVRAC